MSALGREVIARSLGGALGLGLGGLVALAARDNTWASIYAAAPATGGMLGLVYATRVQRGAPLASVAARMGGAAVVLGAVLACLGNHWDLGAALVGIVLVGPIFLGFTVVTALVWAWLLRSLLRLIDRALLPRGPHRAGAR